MIKELERFPKFTITNIANKKDCIGVFDCDLIVKDNNLGYLIGGLNEAYKGRFYDLNRDIRKARFVPKNANDLSQLVVDTKYAYFDCYWGEIAELILDDTKQWNSVKYEPKDAIVYKTDKGNIMGKIGQKKLFETEDEGTFIKNGWDHEHCAICTEKIGWGGQSYGYVDNSDKWVCEKCFIELVKTRSLSYIEDETILTQIRCLNK